jgi:hypothetical protein
MGRIVGREFLSFAANAMLFMSSVHICQGPITLSLQVPYANEQGVTKRRRGPRSGLSLFSCSADEPEMGHWMGCR